MATSCASSREVSFFSSAVNFFASSRVPSNVSRILTKARMTHSTPLRAGSHAHLNGARTAKDICSLKCAVLSKGPRAVGRAAAALETHRSLR